MKNITLFLSSTFKDMQAERDYIRKYVVPRLNDQLSEHNISVSVTDLRWGINTQKIKEEEREAKVLHVCLDAIKATRPYFIALLGDRYGWIPSSKRIEIIKQQLDNKEQEAIGDTTQCSVTELEIRTGAIGTSELLSHSFFCFRRNESYRDMPQADLTDYIDDESEEADKKIKSQKIQELKSRITELCKENNFNDHLIEYSAKWNSENKKMENLKELGDKLYQAILNDIIDENSIHPQVQIQSTEKEIQKLNSFILSNIKNFQGRKEQLDSITSFLLRHTTISSILKEDDNGYFIVGESGLGKSCLFSAIYHNLNKIAKEESILLLPHAAGITPKSRNFSQMIKNWCLLIKNFLGETWVEAEYNVAQFQKLLDRVIINGATPIILIDSLDSFNLNSENRNFHNFSFIPHFVPFVCTTLPGYLEDLLEKSHPYKIVQLNTFTAEDALLIIKKEFEQNSKDFSKELADQILSKKTMNGTPAHHSPFWVRMALNILMELGDEDFREMHKEDLDYDIYLRQIIDKLPPTTDQLFNYLLQQTCHYFNPRIVNDSLTFIALTEYGLTEKKLAELFGDVWDDLDFTSLRHWLRDFLDYDHYTHKCIFSHSILKNVLLHKDKEEVNRLKNILYKFITESALKDNEDIDEFVNQVVNNNDYEIIHYYVNTREDCFPLTDAFTEQLQNHKKETIDFMDAYMQRYYKEVDVWVDPVIDNYINRNCPEGLTPEDQDRFYDLCLIPVKHFKESDLLKGTSETLDYFFRNNYQIMSLLDNEETEDYENRFIFLRDIYLKNKRRLGIDMLNYGFEYTIYRYWANYLRILRRKTGDDEKISQSYKKCFEELLSEVEWYVTHMSQYYGQIATYHRIFDSEFYRYNYAASQEELVGYARRIHTDFIALKPDDNEEENKKEEFNEMAADMISSYKRMFEKYEKVIETPLLRMYNVEIKEPVKAKFETSYIGSTNRPNNKEVSENHLQHNIQESLDDLNRYSRIHSIQRLDRTDEAQEIMDTYYEKIKSIASLYVLENNLPKARKTMNSAAKLLGETLHKTNNNYALYVDEAENIIDLCNWYGQYSGKDCEITLLEAFCNAAWQTYYHHPDDGPHITLLVKLSDLYQEQNLIQKNTDLLEKMFDFSFRYHRETSFDIYELYYKDLSYARIPYNRLRNYLQKTHQVEKLIATLLKWRDLCDMTYIGSRYYTDALEDYREIDKWLTELGYDVNKFSKFSRRSEPIHIEKEDEKLEVNYEYRAPFGNNSIAAVSKDGKYGYVNQLDEEIIPLEYDKTRPFSEGYAGVALQGQRYREYVWGFINQNNERITTTDFSEVGDFNDSRAWILKKEPGVSFGFQGGKYGFIDTKGQLVIDMIYDDVSSFYKGKALVFKGKHHFYIDTEGNNINE